MRTNSPMPELSSRLSKRALEGLLKEKGWTILDAAQFLDVSRQYLYSNFDDPRRPRLLDCAILGLPRCSPEIAQELKAARDRLKSQKPKPAKRTSGSTPNAASSPDSENVAGILEIGAGVSALKYVGKMAEEGAEGWVRRIFRVGDILTYSIEFPGVGTEDFPESLVKEFFVENGKQAPV